MCGSCLATRRSYLIGVMCGRLPCGTGVCCYAFVEYLYFLFLLSSFHTFRFWSGIDKSTAGSAMPCVIVFLALRSKIVAIIWDVV